MGLCPDSYHWLLRHSGAGAVNRSYEQQLSKEPEWRWMEAGPAFALSFPHPSAPAGSHLLPGGSCATHSVLHGPSVDLAVTFWTAPLRLWNSLASDGGSVESSGTVIPFPQRLSSPPAESACKAEVARSAWWSWRDWQVGVRLLPTARTLPPLLRSPK